MDDLTEKFFQRMIMWFPTKKDEYQRMKKKYGKVLETVVIEDIFMPEIIKLLSVEQDRKHLEDIFAYFEVISNSNDEHLINVLD